MNGRHEHFLQEYSLESKCVQTIHGGHRFHGRRINTCRCQVKRGYSPAFFPLGELIPRRTTPRPGTCSPNWAPECRTGKRQDCCKSWVRTYARQPHDNLAPHDCTGEINRLSATRGGTRRQSWPTVRGQTRVGWNRRYVRAPPSA